MQYIIYHQKNQNVPCVDGLVSAWIAKKVYPEAILIAGIYNQDFSFPSPLQAEDSLLLVDFSCPALMLQQWCDQGIRVKVIDHHQTAEQMLSTVSSSLFDYKFDLSECGATLTWKSFFTQVPMPLLLKYVKDRDLWLKKYPKSDTFKQIIDDLAAEDIETVFYQLNLMEYWDQETLDYWIETKGRECDRKKQEMITEALSRVQQTQFGSYQNIPFVLVEPTQYRFVSDICEALIQSYPQAPFTACLIDNKTWEIRGNQAIPNPVNVGHLALQYGGGGHATAAGFPVSTFRKVLES